MGEHDGHRSRLRERFETEGLDGFQAHEVLELLLTYVIPRQDTNPIAHRLLERFGSLRAVLEAEPRELADVPGMGEKSAAFIGMIVPVMRRYEKEKTKDRPVLDRVSKLKEYCSALLAGEREEKLYLLCMDASLKVISHAMLAKGTVNGISVFSRQVAAEAVRRNATGVVLVHNHPSGGTEPSNEDLSFTADCARALNALDIRLYDHLIVGDECVSLREKGLI